jgi:hypothetical protein
LSIVGALGLVTGLMASSVAAQADTSMSDSTFQAMVNYYVSSTNNGGSFCYAQPASTTACPIITQDSTGQNNFAICVESTNANPATQPCTIIQNGTGHNIAIILQRIRQNGAATEDGTQTGDIDQTTGVGSNLAATVQMISQQFGNRPEDPTQHDSQRAGTNQTSTSGHNFKLLQQSSQQDAASALGGTQTSSEDGNINQAAPNTRRLTRAAAHSRAPI